MFSIDLANKYDEVIEALSYREFRIKIGDFEESFLSPLCYWSVEEYQTHWVQNLCEFVRNGEEKTFLITQMYDPAIANFIRWWVLYRRRDDVAFQEKILFLDDLKEPFSIGNATSYIPDHQLVNEDGIEISEWVLPINQIKISPLLKSRRA